MKDQSMREAPETFSLRRVAACCAATLVAYIGIVHEVVGTTLYPDGPDRLGGPLGWHAVGVSGIAVGVLLVAGVLRWSAVPVKALGVAVGVAGVGFVITTALMHRGFHFFAFTLVLAAGVLVLTASERRAASTSLG